MRPAYMRPRARMIGMRAVVGLALLLGLWWAGGARAQVSVATFNGLKAYTAQVAQRMLDLEKRVQAQDAEIAALVAAHNAQRVWIVDFACKWNLLLAQVTTATELPPAPGPVVKGLDCAGTGPAPEWPAAIARP